MLTGLDGCGEGMSISGLVLTGIRSVAMKQISSVE